MTLQFFRTLLSAVLRPKIWRWFIQPRLEALSGKGFRALFPSRDTNEKFLEGFHSNARLRFFYHPRNQKDFFLNLLTQSQSFEEILSEGQDVLEDRLAISGPELNRFHQVWWLGKPYWVTRNEEYALKFRKLVEDWTEQNPTGKGPHWAVTGEVALRASNWIAGYYFFCESSSIPQDFWMKFLMKLYIHAAFISYHSEAVGAEGSVTTFAGLIFLGIFFRGTKAGRRWLEQGMGGFEVQMREYMEGVRDTKPAGRSRLALELFYTAAILCRKNKIPLSGRFMQQLEQQFEFLLRNIRPDGSIPPEWNREEGRLFRLSLNENVNDPRSALSVGAVLFERKDFRLAAGKFYQDALWLFGGEGFEVFQRLGREHQD